MNPTAPILLTFLILTACTPPPTSPVPSPTTNINFIRADIFLQDNGRSFTFPVSTQFTIYLDDQNYPADELHCSPQEILDYISSGSLFGPEAYPVTLEAIHTGTCALTDRSFSVQIVVK